MKCKDNILNNYSRTAWKHPSFQYFQYFNKLRDITPLINEIILFENPLGYQLQQSVLSMTWFRLFDTMFDLLWTLYLYIIESFYFKISSKGFIYIICWTIKVRQLFLINYRKILKYLNLLIFFLPPFLSFLLSLSLKYTMWYMQVYIFLWFNFYYSCSNYMFKLIYSSIRMQRFIMFSACI